MRKVVGVSVVMLLAVAAFVVMDSHRADAQRQAGMPGSFEEARNAYQQHLGRPSSYIRTRSAERMASFRQQEGFDLLVQRYQRLPDGPDEVVRHTTASICGEFYDNEQFVETWEEWLARSGRTNDSWLWFHGQRIRARHGQLDEVLHQLERERDVFLRAATLEALGATGRPEALEAIPQLLGDRMRGSRIEQGVLIEACASVLYRMRHELGSELYKEAATHVIQKLGERRVPDRTKLVIARHLKEIFNEPEAHDDVHAWMRSLERGTRGDEGGHQGPTRVEFMDIPAVGDRVVFLIDTSDSMLVPLSEEEEEELRGPVTGGGRDRDSEDELPWDKINNRFELAREELKRTVGNLPDDLYFTVVVYGDEAELLDSTPRLVQANSRVKRAVIAELDAIKAGPARDTGDHMRRQYGTLNGNTNIHGAFLKAFRVTTRGVLREDEHVNTQGFENGADTIFLLSDAAPSVDSFMQVDRREPEDMAGDPEYRRRAEDQSATHLRYPGPYVRRLHQINHLIEDVRRMNLHRKAEIHTIGMGAFDPGLLEAFAQVGMGQFRPLTEGHQGFD